MFDLFTAIYDCSFFYVNAIEFCECHECVAALDVRPNSKSKGKYVPKVCSDLHQRRPFLLTCRRFFGTTLQKRNQHESQCAKFVIDQVESSSSSVFFGCVSRANSSFVMLNNVHL